MYIENKKILDAILGEQPSLLPKILIEIELRAKELAKEEKMMTEYSDDEEPHNYLPELDSHIVVLDILIRFVFSFNGSYWRRWWEIGRFGSKYGPLLDKDWLRKNRKNEENDGVYESVTKRFCYLLERKKSDLYWYIVSKLEELMRTGLGEDRDVSVSFYAKRSCRGRLASRTYKYKVVRPSDWVDTNKLEVTVGGTIVPFDIDIRKSNKEIAMEILCSLLEIEKLEDEADKFYREEDDNSILRY
jgi:hypothetical protein